MPIPMRSTCLLSKELKKPLGDLRTPTNGGRPPKKRLMIPTMTSKILKKHGKKLKRTTRTSTTTQNSNTLSMKNGLFQMIMIKSLQTTVLKMMTMTLRLLIVILHELIASDKDVRQDYY
jgi:hypothetical protein